MKKAIIILVIFSLLFSSTIVFADSKEYVWDYYTYRLPDGFVPFSEKESTIGAAQGNSHFMVLNRVDLSLLGLTVSSDLLGELNTLNTVLNTVIPYVDNTQQSDSGTINGSAYVITTGSVENEGELIKVAVVGLLKKNHMLWGYFYSPTLFESTSKAKEFIQTVKVSDEIQDNLLDHSSDWAIEEENNGIKTTFTPFDDVKISVSVPNNFEIYMPGMGDNSPVPEHFQFTSEEMDQYMATIKTTMSAYLLAADLKTSSILVVIVNKMPSNLGQLTNNGEYSQSVVESYYKGFALTQGKYEKKTIGGRIFYYFPEYSAGYKLRAPFGENEISLLFKPMNNEKSDDVYEILKKIAGSIVIDSSVSTEVVSSVEDLSNIEYSSTTLYNSDIDFKARMTLDYPSDWICFKRGMNEKDLSNYGLTSDKVDAVLEDLNAYLQIVDTEGNNDVYFVFSDSDLSMDFSSMSNSLFDTIIKTHESSENVQNAVPFISSEDSIKFLKLYYNGSNLIEYITVRDTSYIATSPKNRALNILCVSHDGAISRREELIFDSIVNSIVLNDPLKMERVTLETPKDLQKPWLLPLEDIPDLHG